MRNGNKPISWEDRLVRAWVLKNRTVLSQIAVQLTTTHQFVQAAAYGNSTASPSHPVFAMLREKGWPGCSPKPKGRHH